MRRLPLAVKLAKGYLQAVTPQGDGCVQGVVAGACVVMLDDVAGRFHQAQLHLPELYVEVRRLWVACGDGA